MAPSGHSRHLATVRWTCLVLFCLFGFAVLICRGGRRPHKGAGPGRAGQTPAKKGVFPFSPYHVAAISERGGSPVATADHGDRCSATRLLGLQSPGRGCLAASKRLCPTLPSRGAAARRRRRTPLIMIAGTERAYFLKQSCWKRDLRTKGKTKKCGGQTLDSRRTSTVAACDLPARWTCFVLFCLFVCGVLC